MSSKDALMRGRRLSKDAKEGHAFGYNLALEILKDPSHLGGRVPN